MKWKIYVGVIFSSALNGMPEDRLNSVSNREPIKFILACDGGV